MVITSRACAKRPGGRSGASTCLERKPPTDMYRGLSVSLRTLEIGTLAGPYAEIGMGGGGSCSQ